MIDGQNSFDQTVKKNDLKTYDNIQKIATGQGHDYIHNWWSTRLSFYSNNIISR